jgi:uncharacterized protein
MKRFNPEEYLIFEGITGSNLYGTATPDSDIDYRGICLEPIEVMLNPFTSFEQKDAGFEEEDRAIYSLGKFLKLCAESNPNIVELLFIPENKTLVKTKEWDAILANKNLFLSKKAKFRFLGYGYAQLNLIKRHRQWFLNPPKSKPQRSDFKLTETPLISGENLDIALNIPHALFKDEFHDELVRERNYRLAKKQWDNYISWRDNRNPKRKGYEEKFGYDLKCAMHLVRLMNEGKELLLTGNLVFPLDNAKELLEIKNGKYSFDEFLLLAEDMKNQFELWYDQSPLPKSPDRNSLTELYLDIIMHR